MLGWSRGGFAWWHFFAILAAFIAFANVVDHFWPEKENDLTRILQSSRSAVYIIALVATFTAPLVEEVVYRGVVYSAFRKHFGVPAGFIVATLLFALVHVPQYYPSYSTIFLLTMLSVTLTSIRVMSGNLLPCIILHTIFNGLQSVLLILQPLTDQPALFRTRRARSCTFSGSRGTIIARPLKLKQPLRAYCFSKECPCRLSRA